MSDLREVVPATTLGEVDPVFCELVKQCVRRGSSLNWMLVYVQDVYGIAVPHGVAVPSE